MSAKQQHMFRRSFNRPHATLDSDKANAVLEGRIRYATLKVWLALYGHANGRWEAYPSNETLAGETLTTVRSVQRALRELLTLGWVADRGKHDEYGTRVWRLLKSEHEGEIAAEHATQRCMSTPLAGDASPAKSGGDIGVADIGVVLSPTPMSPKREAIPEREAKDKYTDDATQRDTFPEWWARCPRKIGKGQARRAYTAALKKASPEELAEGMERFARSCVGRDPKFICHPSTWLNGERWLDDEGHSDHESWGAVSGSYPGPRPAWSSLAYSAFLKAEGLGPGQVMDRIREFVGHYQALGKTLPPLGVLFDASEKPLSDQNLDGLREAARHRQRVRGGRR